MMIKRYLFIFLSLVFVAGARAELNVDIVAGNAKPLPIAILPFEAKDSSLKKTAAELTSVIENDLKSTGLFHLIDKEAFPEKVPFGTMPTFVDWRALNANALIQGQVSAVGKDKVRLQFYVWDVTSGEQIEAQSLVASKKTVRRLAHIMADAVYERLTGEAGYFDTQIVFISESGPMDKRIKRLAIMDSDGYGFRYMSGPEVFVMSPHWSPSMHAITFLSFRGDDPHVWTLDMVNGAQSRLGKFAEMTFSPRFSPDGKKVAFSMVDNGATNLYELDLSSRALRQLTFGDGINTSPAYSPDGKQMAFNSNRSGSQQLHIMDLDTLKEHRLTFGNGRYATPAWSPRGDFIAFTKIANDTFSIGIMTPEGKGERILSTGWFMESPSWAPNGRRVIYTETEKGVDDKERISKLMSVDITGQNSYELKTPGYATDPAWSPRLP